MLGTKCNRKVVLAVVSLLVVGTFIFSSATMGYAADMLRKGSAAKDEKIQKKLWSTGFAGELGKTLAHDKVFVEKAKLAYDEGRVINLIGHQAEQDLATFAENLIKKNGEVGITKEELVAKLSLARDFLTAVFEPSFVNRIVNKIAGLDENKAQEEVTKAQKALAKAKASFVKAQTESEITKAQTALEKATDALYRAEKTLEFVKRIKEIAAIGDSETRTAVAIKAIINDTRFPTFIFGTKGLDPSLFDVGNILSEEHRALVAHIGTYAYEGSDNIIGGPRSTYHTLGRILGFAEKGDEGVEEYRDVMEHEFVDRAYGRHVDSPAAVVARVNKTNAEIDRKYKEEIKGIVTEVTEKGSVIVSNDKVTIEKYRTVNDLDIKDVYVIAGRSKVHPDVPKGSGQKITVTIAKADIGSIGGHGTAPGLMLEAVAERWMKAAEQGLIEDFWITRVGDDISVTVTHIKGIDNEQIHRIIWEGFVQAAVVAKDLGFYAAGQDLLAEAFSGNVKGAGPSVAEMEFEEAEAEVLIIGQADKTAPGAYSRGLWEILFSPNTTWRPLGKGQARDIKVGVLDFEHNNKAGRHIWFGKEDYDDAAWYLGSPDRYTIDNVTLKDGEPFAAVTAQRLSVIAGEYIGKDDPMFMIRSQSRWPAVGEISSAFLKGTYIVPGWMRGSNKGPFLPVALKDAKIGIYDGPPLLGMWSFNLNNGHLEGFYDLMAANPAIRYIQDRRSAKAVEMLEQGFDEMNLRLGQEEIEYQAGPALKEKQLTGRWEEFKSEDEKAVAQQRAADEVYQLVAQKVAEQRAKEQRTGLFKEEYGGELAPIVEELATDIRYQVPFKAKALHMTDKISNIPILIEHESLLKRGQEGIMAFLNLVEQLGEGKIKPVLHINRDDIKPEERENVIADAFEKINKINGDRKKINRDKFAAIVFGTNPEDISNQVQEQLGAPIYQVIGPEQYVNQFKTAMRISLDKAKRGELTLLAKALKLAVNLIAVDGKISVEDLQKLDALFSMDTADGTFHVKSSKVVETVLVAADKFEKEVKETGIRI